MDVPVWLKERDLTEMQMADCLFCPKCALVGGVQQEDITDATHMRSPSWCLEIWQRHCPFCDTPMHWLTDCDMDALWIEDFDAKAAQNHMDENYLMGILAEMFLEDL